MKYILTIIYLAQNLPESKLKNFFVYEKYKKEEKSRKGSFSKGGNDIPCTLHEITEPFILNKKPFPTPYNFC